MRSSPSRAGIRAAGARSESMQSGSRQLGSNRASVSVTSSQFSRSRSSRMRGRVGTTSTRTRDEASRRAQELKQEMEAAIHVLDNGVNRTPLPLQHRQSLAGARGGSGGGGGGAHESVAGGELGSSVFQSSFFMSTEGTSGSKQGGGGGLSGYLQSSSSAGRHGGGRRRDSAQSMESSMQSLSMAGDSMLYSQIGDRGHRGSDASSMSAGAAADSFAAQPRPSGAGVDLAALREPQGLLDGAATVSRKTLTDVERRAWLRARTTVSLTETPTVFLFERQDEAVSNEAAYLVEEVRERNELYADVVEAHRIDEGTRFQERGTATFTVAKKSTHSEVHPQEKVDAGGLQVAPWMLKDAFAPLADDADEDAEGNDDQRPADGVDGADGEGGGGGDGGAEDVELADDMDEKGTQNDDSASGANELASGDQSGRRTSTATGAAAGAGGRGLSQWMLADSLMSTLRVMERAVVQNIMEKTQLAYRGVHMGPESARLGAQATPQQPRAKRKQTAAAVVPAQELEGNAVAADAADALTEPNAALENSASASRDAPLAFPESDLPAMSTSEGIKALWRYHSAHTRGRNVTCMAWNRKETDILAVGYSPRRASVGGQEDLDEDDANRAPAAGDEAAVRADGRPAARHRQQNAGDSTSRRGEQDTAYQRGMICCWSLKNPLAPELVLHLPADAGVSSLAFSAEHPSLLAVGDTEGGIVVYDIQKDLAMPSIVPTVSTGLHTGAVWALKWVTSGKEGGEFLMSTSADGRVVQWAVGKTVEKVAPDLMHLKRQAGTQVESAFVDSVAAAEEAAVRSAAANATRGRRGREAKAIAAAAGTRVGPSSGPKEDAVLSRQAGGMCFDVCPADHAIYIVGTEDGSVYQCNKSQTESYDLDYAAHAELVYRIRWSPFSATFFLTCSADWTTRLYALGQAAPLMQFEGPNQDAVQDVAWSYSNALFFATATAQGHVELWCVGDTIYPRASVHYDDHRRLNCLLFAEQETPVMVVGDDEGDVTVFLLRENPYGRQELTDDEQEMWLEEAVKKVA